MSNLRQRIFSKSEWLSPAISEQDRDALIAIGDTGCVTILLCTCNGARFLRAQLASIEKQSHHNWRLIVSDDGSTDETANIARNFSRRVSHPVEMRQGPRTGPCANFLSLATDPSIEGRYFAFCDQDDVWHATKLTRALQWLGTIPEDIPAVYGARTRLVSAADKPIGHSPQFTRPPTFANALVQSIAGGNTMVFNCAAKRLIEKAGVVNAISHDWWAYQLVSGAGGIVHYDRQAHLDYRQHSANRIGCNRGLRAQWQRLRMVLAGGFAVWNDVNLAALRKCSHLLTSDSRALLETFDVMRNGSLAARLNAFLKSGARRQTPLGNVALLAAIVLKKL